MTVIRTLFKVRIDIWMIMAIAAVISLITMQISPSEAWNAIDFEVIVFLISMFTIGEALQESHYLEYITNILFRRVKHEDKLLLLFIIAVGILSMILTNDTIAIIGTTVCFMVAGHSKIPIKCLLLTLAFSVTSISLLSPYGSPQALIIAKEAVFQNAFIEFFIYQIIPTTISVAVLFFMMKYAYHISSSEIQPAALPKIDDIRLFKLCRISVIMVISLIILRSILGFFVSSLNISLMWISIIGMLPIIIGSSKRIMLIRGIDWKTIIFFISMFIFMRSVWNSEFVQEFIQNTHYDVSNTTVIYLIGLLVSQLVSNVPLVMLYIPILDHTNAQMVSYIALVAGSTLAGNLSILGAASNVIVIQQAEKRNIVISFFEFFKIGFPLCIIQSLIYIIYFKLLS